MKTLLRLSAPLLIAYLAGAAAIEIADAIATGISTAALILASVLEAALIYAAALLHAQITHQRTLEPPRPRMREEKRYEEKQ